MPTWSASTPCSATLRSLCRRESGVPSAPTVTSPKVSIPSSIGIRLLSLGSSAQGDQLLLHVVHLAQLRRLPCDHALDQFEQDDGLRLVDLEEHRGMHVDADQH